MRARRRTAWLALLVTATVTVSVDYLQHTHDGCTVEVHCLACRTAVDQTAATAAAVLLPVRVDWVQWLVAPIPKNPQTRQAWTSESRGPPLS